MDRTRAMMTAVDAELRGSITALYALGASRALDNEDLASFREQAVRVLASQPGWFNITLATPDGQQVVNALQPPGAALPRVADAESAKRAVATGRAVVGDVGPGPFGKQIALPVRIAVMRTGEGRKSVGEG